MDLKDALDLSIRRSTLDAIDHWTRVGALALGVLAAVIVAVLVRAEPYVKTPRRVALYAVSMSGVVAFVSIAFYYGGGWLVSPQGYGLGTGDWLFRLAALAGAGVVAIGMMIVGFVFLAVEEP